MGASQAHAHAREPTVPLLPPPAPPPPHVDLSAALLTTSPPLPSLPTHLQLYIDWLFSLPPSSASHFACYLLHLTQSVVLPPVPTPPLVDLIAAPPIESYPPERGMVGASESTDGCRVLYAESRGDEHGIVECVA